MKYIEARLAGSYPQAAGAGRVSDIGISGFSLKNAGKQEHSSLFQNPIYMQVSFETGYLFS
jgi:hypothetical protein